MSETRQARYARRERLRRKLAGLCGRTGCPDNAGEASGYCDKHREERRAYYKARYDAGGKRREQMRKNRRAKRIQRRRAGLCLSCGEPARTQFCAKHVKRARAYEGRKLGPGSYCTACGKRGHYWEDCPNEERIDVRDHLSSGTTNLGAA